MQPTTAAAYRKSPRPERKNSGRSRCLPTCQLCQGNLWRLITIDGAVLAVRCECSRRKPVEPVRDFKMAQANDR